MPLPKSVTKISYKNGKTELTFIDSVDRVNYTMEELVRRANMDVGRYIIRLVQRAVRNEPAFRSLKKAKYVPQRYQYWARKKENDLILGIENTAKGAESAWWADQAELGTNGQPKRAFLYNTVKDNVSTIREIQAQYISAIEDELEAERLVAEAEAMQDDAIGEVEI